MTLSLATATQSTVLEISSTLNQALFENGLSLVYCYLIEITDIGINLI